MEADGKNEKVFRGLENNFFLQWGNRKRLRCVKIRDNNTTNNNTVAVDSDNNNRNNNTQKLRTASRINRRVLNIEKERLHPSSSPNGILREWESWGSESKKSSQPSSPDKEENRFYSTRGSTAAAAAAPHPALADNNNGNGHIGAEEKVGKVGLPRFFISLSSKEKEEDFMAMKGCKLPQRPKKRAKLVQRTILLVSPGAWLSDLSHERYEVREKKSRKRKRGLKVISIESDSEQASLDTHLTSSNVGFRLLQKMGWKGKGLGKHEQGIVEPIKAGIRDSKLGVGKQEEDDFFTAEENVQRRKLEVELEENEESAKNVREHQLSKNLRISCSFYYLVASTASFVPIMKIQVIAEREQKIQIEVKEIRKVFFCDLCNKQYKLAMEFETHLSSYDHNHRKRFKEMREMQSTSSRDDRQKRELIRQEKEMAKFTQMADAQKQRQQLQQQELSTDAPDSSNVPASPVPVPDQRPTLKFGFASKLGGPSKQMATAKIAKKQKVARKVASVFGDDSDE